MSGPESPKSPKEWFASLGEKGQLQFLTEQAMGDASDDLIAMSGLRSTFSLSWHPASPKKINEHLATLQSLFGLSAEHIQHYSAVYRERFEAGGKVGHD